MRPRWIVGTGKEVAFASVDVMAEDLQRRLETVTPEAARAARERNAAILAELSARPDIRAVVWRGEGKSWSSGRDHAQSCLMSPLRITSDQVASSFFITPISTSTAPIAV